MNSQEQYNELKLQLDFIESLASRVVLTDEEVRICSDLHQRLQSDMRQVKQNAEIEWS